MESDEAGTSPSGRERQEVRHLFEQVFEHAPTGMAVVALDGRCIRVNGALCEITGYRADELLAKPFIDITHPDDIDEDAEEHQRLLNGEIRHYRTEKRYLNAKGHAIWVRISASLVRRADGQPDYFVTQVEDISNQKRMEQQLRDLADNDGLTGLRNRRFFEESLMVQIGRCQRYGENATLLVIDLDGFKQVNDAFGHRAGDRLLRAVADTIKNRIRASDTAARIGGDEFAALLLHTSHDKGAMIATNVKRRIADTKIQVGDRVIHAAASIGVAHLDEGIPDGESALADADHAMYADKSARHQGPPAGGDAGAADLR